MQDMYRSIHRLSPHKNSWWVKDDEYVVAFDVIPGYDVIEAYPVKSWLPAGIKRIYALRRTSLMTRPSTTGR